MIVSDGGSRRLSRDADRMNTTVTAVRKQANVFH